MISGTLKTGRSWNRSEVVDCIVREVLPQAALAQPFRSRSCQILWQSPRSTNPCSTCRERFGNIATSVSSYGQYLVFRMGYETWRCIQRTFPLTDILSASPTSGQRRRRYPPSSPGSSLTVQHLIVLICPRLRDRRKGFGEGGLRRGGAKEAGIAVQHSRSIN